jgi:hypothetical protein
MTSLRDSLVVITTIATILGFYFKIFNNFFMKIIKREYENLPGNQSMFDMTLKYLAYTGIFVYITVMFILVAKSISNNSNFDNVKNLHWIIWLFVIVVFVMFFYILFLLINIIRTTFYNFDKLKKLFFERMNGITNIPSNKMKMESKINSFLLSAIVVIFGVQIIREIINCFELVKSNKATDQSIMVIITLIFVELFISAILIVSVNLQRLIEEFVGNYTYIVLTEAEEIKCKCYIELNEYYLILENGIERYINKSKIKEIKKILKVKDKEVEIKYSLRQIFKNIFFTIRFNIAFNKEKLDI